MVCFFFEDGILESIGNFIISSIMTKVGGAGVLILGGTLQKRSCKYLSQSFFDPIEITLWLVPA